MRKSQIGHPVDARHDQDIGKGELPAHEPGALFCNRFIHAPAGFGKRFGLLEPLDGIVMGVASGSGFFIAETLVQYVPGAMKQVKYPGSQAFDGLVLLLGRGLPDIAEHSAWAGLFGYFIGLAALRPNMAYILVPLGWLSAAALHAGWDAIDVVTSNGIVILSFWVFVGLLSYALLAGAIFKAREISPRRHSRVAAGLHRPPGFAAKSAAVAMPLAAADRVRPRPRARRHGLVRRCPDLW